MDARNRLLIGRLASVAVPVVERQDPHGPGIRTRLQRRQDRFRRRGRLRNRIRNHIRFHRRVGGHRLRLLRHILSFPGIIRFVFRLLRRCGSGGRHRCNRSRRGGCGRCRRGFQPLQDHRHRHAAPAFNRNIPVCIIQVPARLKETGHRFNLNPGAFRQGDRPVCLDLADFFAVLPYTEPAVQLHIFAVRFGLAVHTYIQRHRFRQDRMDGSGQQQHAQQDGKKSSRLLHVAFSLRKQILRAFPCPGRARRIIFAEYGCLSWSSSWCCALCCTRPQRSCPPCSGGSSHAGRTAPCPRY